MHDIAYKIDYYSTPESIVDFLFAITEWIPEYEAIEENIRANEKQKKMTCDIAYTILQRNIRRKLQEKGYTCDINQFEYEANFRINFSGGISLSYEINLLEDFSFQLEKIVDSLPPSSVMES